MPLMRFACVAMCAIGAHMAAAGAPAPSWGSAYRGGTPLYDLTRHTQAGGICLDDADLTGDPDEIRFVAGEISVDHIEVRDRDIAFVGNAGGTTLKADARAVRECGGAIAAIGGSVAVSNLVFSGFAAETVGGALLIREMTGDSSVVGCSFLDCSAAPVFGGVGGAIYVSADGSLSAAPTLSVRDSAFVSCSAACGGAIASERISPYDEKVVAVDVADCRFESNVSVYSGGAMWIEGDATFSNTCFRANLSGSDGGAVCAGSSDVDFAGLRVRCLAGTVFEGNVAEDAENGWSVGGAIALASGNIVLDVSRTAFLANSSGVNGGAVFACSNSSVTVSTCIFSGNVVMDGGLGGALSVENSIFAMTNSTVRGSNGTALDLYDTPAELVNCVVADNGDSDIAGTGGLHAALTLKTSAYGRVSGFAPQFEDCLADCTASIFSGSSLILRVSPYNPVAAEGLVQDATDFVGTAYGSRPFGYSMGAYECETDGKYVIHYEPGCEATGTMPDEYWIWGVETNISPNAFVPVDNALRFLGWVTNSLPAVADCVVFGDGQGPVINLAEPQQTNVLTAVWTTNYVVYGNIGGDYVGVTVQLAPVGVPDESQWYKGDVMGDPASCTYTVQTPFSGEYDLVADFLITNGDVTVTNRVRVTSGFCITEFRTRVDISAPAGHWNSEVNNEESGDWPAIARGLDEVATNSIPTDATRVEVELIVTDKPDVSEYSDEETNSWMLITAAATTNDLDDTCNPERVVKVFDLTVVKRTTYSDGCVVTNYPGRNGDPEDIEHPLRVLIPFDMEGRTDFWIYRCHEGEEIPLDYRPEILTDPNDLTDDCWAYVENTPPAQSYFVIQSSKFSMYGVGFRGAKLKGVGDPWIEWVYDSNSALYYGRFALENYDGWPNTIENLTFHFPARTNESGRVVAQMYSMDGKPVESIAFDNRFTAVDTCEDETVTWGGDDDYYTVESRRRGTLLYPDKSKFSFYLWIASAYRPNVSNLLSQISYDSYGWTNRLTTTSNRDLSIGRGFHSRVQTVGNSLPLTKVSLAAYNQSIAVGAAVTEDSPPNCSLSAFSFADGEIFGRVKVGAGDEVGSLGVNAAVELLGSSGANGAFRSLGTVDCDAEGDFTFKPPEDVRFFRVRITVRDVVK